MKDPHFIKQKDGNPTTCPLFNFRTKLNEKTLNIAPLNITAGRPRKYQFNNSLVLLPHSAMVPNSGTARNAAMVGTLAMQCGPEH